MNNLPQNLLGAIPAGETREWNKDDNKRYFRQCDVPQCKHRARIRDWANWKWCICHFIRNTKQSEHPWTELRLARFNKGPKESGTASFTPKSGAIGGFRCDENCEHEKLICKNEGKI